MNMKYPLLFSKAWLTQKYLIERLSSYKIKNIIGCKTQRSVIIALSRFGIKSRTHSEAWEFREAMPQCVRDKISKKLKGEQSYRWKGGKKRENGYDFIYLGMNKYKKLSRCVAEKILGRILKKREIVHHINQNKLDNRPENLFVFRHNTAHLRWHGFLRKHRLSGGILTSNLYAR